jgi:FMN phosphatase YigB (HAD superfamily)
VTHYKFVFVDWYKTLSRSVFWEQLKNDVHPYHSVFEPIQQVLLAESSDVINRWMRGQLTSETVVRHLGEALHCNPDILLKELIVSCQNMRLMSESSLNLISELRKTGVKVVIATDNMDTFHRWTIPSLRLANHFDAILSSFELGALKGDTDATGSNLFFTHYLKSNDIGQGESLLLDDSNQIFGDTIRRCGIDYQCVEPGKLDDSLERILISRQQAN